MKRKIEGLITALATPYFNGAIDMKSYAYLLEKQISEGADGLLCLGTTAEPSLLTAAERKKLLKAAVRAAKGKTAVICGTGTASTAETVILSRYAEDNGADALLIAPPPFSKCTPEGYVRHIEAVIKATALPVIMYNVPSRAGYALDTDAVRRCFEAGAYAVKDASECGGYTDRLMRYGKVFCGSDEKTQDYIRKGAAGTISVVSNLCPSLTKKIINRTASEQEREAFESFARACFTEVSPVPIKYALFKSGIFRSCEMRLPLTAAGAETRRQIDGVTEKYGNLLK